MSLRWLIVRNGAVGDTVLLSSAVRAIRECQTDAHIEVMGLLDRVSLLIGPDLADCAISAERPGIESLYGAGDLHPDLHDYFAEFSHILIYAARPIDPARIRARPDQWVAVHPALPPQGRSRHVVEHYLDPLRTIVGDGPAPEPKIVLFDDEITDAREELRELGLIDAGAPLAVHLGAGGASKRAPVERFLEAIEGMYGGDQRFLVIEGPADEGSSQELIAALGEENCSIITERPLRELAALIGQCRAFIGNDSGPAHIAAALGLPATVFFVASDPAVWAPRGDGVKVIDLRDGRGKSSREPA